MICSSSCLVSRSSFPRVIWARRLVSPHHFSPSRITFIHSCPHPRCHRRARNFSWTSVPCVKEVNICRALTPMISAAQTDRCVTSEHHELSSWCHTWICGLKASVQWLVFVCLVHVSLKSIHESLAVERERVRQAWTGPDLRQSTSHQLATLCTTLTEVNTEAITCLLMTFIGTKFLDQLHWIMQNSVF